MTNPFSQLLPVNLPFSGTTDSSGNFKVTLRPRPGFWCAGKVIAKTAAGSPVWEVTDDAIPFGVGRGQRAEIAGIVVPPGASIIVSCIAAQPTIAVTGRFLGVQGPTMESISPAIIPVPNTIALDVAAASEVMFTIPAQQFGGGGSTVTGTIPIPGNTMQVGYAFRATNFLTNMMLTGHQTGIVYVNDSANFRQIPYPTVIDPADTSLDWSLSGVNGPSLPVDLIGWQSAVIPSTLTVQEGANPPLWQAPNKAPVTLDSNIGAGGTINPIGASVNQTVRLFGIALTAAAGGPLQLRDSNHVEFASVAAGATWGVNLGGAALALSQGVEILAPGAATSVNGTISYSQG